MSESTVIAPQKPESPKSSESQKNRFRGFRVNWKSRKNRTQLDSNQSAPPTYTTTVPVHAEEINEDDTVRYSHGNIDKQFSRGYEPGTGALSFTFPASSMGNGVTESQTIESFAGGDPETGLEIQMEESQSESEDYMALFGTNPLARSATRLTQLDQSDQSIQPNTQTEYEKFQTWLNQERRMTLDDFEDSYEEFTEWKRWKKG